MTAKTMTEDVGTLIARLREVAGGCAQTQWHVFGDDACCFGEVGDDGIPYIEIASGEVGTPEFVDIAHVQPALNDETDEFELTAASRAYALFIATFNPATVQALLQKAEADAAALRASLAREEEMRKALEDIRNAGTRKHISLPGGETYDVLSDEADIADDLLNSFDARAALAGAQP